MRITRTGSGATARIDDLTPATAMRRRIRHGGHGTTAINLDRTTPARRSAWRSGWLGGQGGRQGVGRHGLTDDDRDRDDLTDAFAAFPARLAGAARLATGRPVPAGEWGPAEVARHLIAVESEVFQARLSQVAAEDDPHWAWTEPGLAPGFDDASLDAVLAAFASVRAATVATLRSLDDAGWTRHGTHATYGVLDVAGLLRIAIDHDEDHLRGLGGS